MKKVNLLVGRFQPITEGHIKCVKQAQLPTVLAIIDTPENKVDSKHPFPTDMLLPFYEELIYNKTILDIVRVKNADIVAIGEAFKEKGYQIGSWTCGTDRVSSYKRMSEKYADKAGLSDDFELIEIKRSNTDISATRARQLLQDDNANDFWDLTPKALKSNYKTFVVYYGDLQDQLEKVLSK